MENKNPISPHIQIYNWHISSLVSISHRITGIINFITITFIGLWIASLLLGEQNYEFIRLFMLSFFALSVFAPIYSWKGERILTQEWTYFSRKLPSGRCTESCELHLEPSVESSCSRMPLLIRGTH